MSDPISQTNLTPEQATAARKLQDAHRRFSAADEELDATEAIHPVRVLEYLTARNLLREATENVERAFAPLMP